MSNRSNLPPRACVTCGGMFAPYRDTHVACSRACRARQPHIRDTTEKYFAREEVRERKNTVRRVANNPERREINLRRNLAQYGLTPDMYRAMLAAQGGLCAICGEAPPPDGIKASSRLHVDHDHATGKVRALLCTRCNRGIGYMRDRPDLLRLAAEYIERYSEGAG